MKKKSIYTLGLILLLSIAPFTQLNAQAFGGKGSTQLTIGLGVTQHRTTYPENGKGPKGTTNPIYGSLNIQFEFGIAKYVGLGVHIGGEFANNLSRSYSGLYNLTGLNINSNSAFRSIGVPVAFYGNFHFLQLISDKSGKSISEKLDVYAGLSIGSGPAFALAKSGYKEYKNDVGFLIYGGPHAGIRFYPKSNVGIYAELGYGKSYFNGGISFKF